MRCHLLAPPNVQTTAAYALDGFGQATIRFAKVLERLGAETILYASDENEAPCAELVNVLTKQEQAKALGDRPYQYAAADNRYQLWQLANERTIAAIGARKQSRDLILTIGGTAQQAIADAHPDLMTVEYSIGYEATFAKYRVFESRVWQAYCHGKDKEPQGRFFDAVIPLFYDPAAFRYGLSAQERYALFVGRLTPQKGIGIACEAAALAGIPLKVIGHGDPSLVTHGAEYLGALDTTQRNDWMRRAQVLLAPTQYIEPFGGVVVEAQFCGTPAVTSDFGAFEETVHQGVTGFRCHYLGEFVHAIKASKYLDRFAIRARAEAKYSIVAVTEQYRAYFDRLSLLWADGWNTRPRSLAGVA